MSGEQNIVQEIVTQFLRGFLNFNEYESLRNYINMKGSKQNIDHKPKCMQYFLS